MFYGQSPFNYQRPSLGSSIKNFITNKSPLNRLIVINCAVYLVVLFLKLFASLFLFLNDYSAEGSAFQWIVNKLSCPASFQTLLYQPWSMITSLFMHADFWHIFMNMLMLYITGRIFLQYLDKRKLVITYFLGGIAGNLLYMLAYNYFPVFSESMPFSHALGASGSIMAIMAAITVYRPNHEMNLILIGRVKLYWIMIIFVIVDIISIPQGNAGGHIAHLGGVFYGAVSQIFYRHYTPKKRVKKSKTKKQKFATSHDEHWRPMSDEEYNANKQREQEHIDKILDKISKNGYDALTKSEKDFLFNYSKK
ncbi:rhomboid family intramembrane serine protease [Bacteroidales bacterium OttesenSCG-928-L19]|nr:rhomboid family intramembrane serine protease [Bacteroidales bacterium OttesenSCG-928-L19]